MTRQLSASLNYPASLAQLRQLFTERGFYEFRAEAAGAQLTRFEVEQSDDQTVAVHAVMEADAASIPAGTLPEKVRSFVPSRLVVTVVEVWDADFTHATLCIDGAGIPVSLTGKTRLNERGEATERVVDAEIKCTVPFFGAAIERAIPDDVLNTLIGHDGELVERYLQRKETH